MNISGLSLVRDSSAVRRPFVVYVKIVLYSSVAPLSEGMMVMNE
jgi:hypothetical protein